MKKVYFPIKCTDISHQAEKGIPFLNFTSGNYELITSEAGCYLLVCSLFLFCFVLFWVPLPFLMLHLIT